MAAKKLKQGTVIVMDQDIFSENAMILLEGNENEVVGCTLYDHSIIRVPRADVIERLRKQEWYERVPDKF